MGRMKVLVVIVLITLFLYGGMTGHLTEMNIDDKGLILGGLLIGLIAGLYILKAVVSHIMWEYD